MKKIPVIVLVVLGLAFAGLAEAAKPKKRTRNQNRVGPYGAAFVGMTDYSGDQSDDEQPLIDILATRRPFSEPDKDEHRRHGHRLRSSFGYRFIRYIAGELGLVAVRLARFDRSRPRSICHRTPRGSCPRGRIFLQCRRTGDLGARHPADQGQVRTLRPGRLPVRECGARILIARSMASVGSRAAQRVIRRTSFMARVSPGTSTRCIQRAPNTRFSTTSGRAIAPARKT